MKKIGFVGVILAVLSAQPTLAARRAEVQVPIRDVFVPEFGFDDNDNVQIALYGELEDPCYTLGEPRFEKSGSEFQIEISQSAWRRSDGVCGSEDLNDSPVRFVKEISLGRLKKGDYQIYFRQEGGVEGVHHLRVDAARVATLDSLSYAPIGRVEGEELFAGGAPAEFSLKGSFPSDCWALSKPAQIKREGSVFVVLPIAEPTRQSGCGSDPVPFEEKISLGKLDPGVYALHVRSRHGRAVYRVFWVLAVR